MEISWVRHFRYDKFNIFGTQNIVNPDMFTLSTFKIYSYRKITSAYRRHLDVIQVDATSQRISRGHFQSQPLTKC